MKNIFIIGSRGYQANYGGWETFVTCLVDNYKDKDTKFYITEYTDYEKENISINKNITIFPIKARKCGGATMFLYTIKSLKYVIKYIEENNIKNSYIYILGLKLFHYLKIYQKKLKKLGITTLVNPDGLEHKRSKWSYPVKKFFLLSEYLMLNHTDKIICDAKGIQDYICNKYPKLKNKTTYIAYGSETIDFKNTNEEEILKEYHLEKDNYCLVVGRCVPENNLELILKEFMKSNIEKKLVIVTNLSSSNYYQELKEKTNFENDKRIYFIDGIYDKIKLATIRKNAYLYIHGHSVGGTNPSLIEALSLTDLNILYDVCFNKEVGQDSCLYFKENNSLTLLLNNKELLEEKKKTSGIKAKKIIKENFTWDIIVNQYKQIFK